MHNKSTAVVVGAILAISHPMMVPAKQPIETETARLPTAGHGDMQFEFEYAKSEDGRDIAMPIVFEYGLTDRLKFVLEPDVYASVNHNGGTKTSGFGDTEAKLVYQVAEETTSSPALAIAGEVKFPTGKRPDLSNGQTDYRVFGIASRRLGAFDLHANLGYTLVGRPAGENLPNVIDYSAAAQYRLSDSVSLVGELLGSTPIGGGGGSSAPAGPDVEGEQTVITGLLGGIFRINPRAEFALAGTYDSSKKLLIRAAFTLSF